MADYMTVVIRMPEDESARRNLAQMLRIGEPHHGGLITAVSTEDEITTMEILEDLIDPQDVADARAQTKEIHATAESAV